MPKMVQNVIRYGGIRDAIIVAMGDMSPTTLADKLGCSPASVYLWRDAKAAPGPKYAEALCRVLDLKPSDLQPREEVLLDEKPSTALVKYREPKPPKVRKLPHPQVSATDIVQQQIRSDGSMTITINVPPHLTNLISPHIGMLIAGVSSLLRQQ